ncbi:O-antigen ligase family protein [Limosilactobacillus reuteri]|uniref:O-antigen ligase family protein n=1 Tax=Limosilactobacillus reuteri TaxID=1598 RepID=UPI0015FD5634|nr:O-antigen ligase family protein [Limosilactobacillus reuteri]MBB1071736.1 O-antigen ligase family protein [Limosilactobacillus reuteri]MCC4511182.1 O-antigen ligase family protein [Limosilactobacillus reuteri]MCC4512829.1 O-antigen ligase family protein [Limosilactobacillus reuteri]
MFQISGKKINTNIYFFLLIILPLMDSLNGLINGGGNENGLSLGIIYRIVIVIVSFSYWLLYGVDRKYLLYFLFVLFYLTISALRSSLFLFSYLVLMFKMILPIIIIITLKILYENNIFNKKSITDILNIWQFLFPLTLLIAYVLGIGFATYSSNATNLSMDSSVGFKGLYYAQNDISYVMDILYYYSLKKLLKRKNIVNIIGYFLSLSSVLLLGLKSGYILVIIITIFMFIQQLKKKRELISSFLFLLFVIVGFIFSFSIFSNDISKVVDRWQYFYQNRTSFFSFLTSMRSDRIVPINNWVNSVYGLIGILFGTGYNYAHISGSIVPEIVEMDLIDIYFQIGIIGIILIYGFYFRIYFQNSKTSFYSNAFILTILISTFNGHVFETALSGVFFAIICSGIFIKED